MSKRRAGAEPLKSNISDSKTDKQHGRDPQPTTDWSSEIAGLHRRIDALEASLQGEAASEPSGPAWVARFPGSTATTDCIATFRASIDQFLAALSAAGASVTISATFRPPERAYLMHWAWKIANNLALPQDAPPMVGVEIQWTHTDDAGAPDIPKSRSAASQMVTGYDIVTLPALVSRHTQGRAIDMTISWKGDLKMRDARGKLTTISSLPRTGMNSVLIDAGATYGVIKAKFANDPPHWSDDGH